MRYNISMDNSQFKPASACYKCRSCGRFTRDTDGPMGTPQLCHECNEWTSAENTLQDPSLSTVDREAVAAYMLQMKRQAIAKGGTLEDTAEPIPTVEIPAAVIPAADIPPLNPHVVNPKRPYGERGQGRKKLPPEWKLTTTTVRVSTSQREKLKRLGPDWLRKAIDRAREPDAPNSPDAAPETKPEINASIDSGAPEAQNAAQ